MKIAIAYIPVVHQGYLNFIQKVKPDVLYVLGEEFYNDFRPIEKDIRKLSSAVIREQLVVSNTGVPEIMVLTKKNLSFWNEHSEVIESGRDPIVPSLTPLPAFNDVALRARQGNNKVTQFILPNEDISHLFAEQYLVNQEVEFIDFFLRWDSQASLKQRELKNKYLADTENFEHQMLGFAYTEAEKSSDFWRQVGAVVVKNRQILLSTHNFHVPSLHTLYANGDPRGNFKKGIHIELSTALHAEAALIAAAAKQGICLLDSEIYVTTFPCPNCAKLIAYSGIKKLYFAEGYSMLDGEEIMRSEGVEIVKINV